MPKYTIECCKEFAKSKGGKCLSEQYFTKNDKLQWQCHLEHMWLANWNNVYYNKSWCPHCSGHIATLEQTQKIAIERGGQCLSSEYINNRTLMEFKCAQNHVFWLSSLKLKQNRWCKYCSKYISQEKCRYILENLTSTKWEMTSRIIPPYQIDMYSPKYNTAFEYNGRQHYEEVSSFHRGKETFENQLERDKNKIQKCEEQGIPLFIIPYQQAKTDAILIDLIN